MVNPKTAKKKVIPSREQDKFFKEDDGALPYLVSTLNATVEAAKAEKFEVKDLDTFYKYAAEFSQENFDPSTYQETGIVPILIKDSPNRGYPDDIRVSLQAEPLITIDSTRLEEWCKLDPGSYSKTQLKTEFNLNEVTANRFVVDKTTTPTTETPTKEVTANRFSPNKTAPPAAETPTKENRFSRPATAVEDEDINDLEELTQPITTAKSVGPLDKLLQSRVETTAQTEPEETKPNKTGIKEISKASSELATEGQQIDGRTVIGLVGQTAALATAVIKTQLQTIDDSANLEQLQRIDQKKKALEEKVEIAAANVKNLEQPPTPSSPPQTEIEQLETKLNIKPTAKKLDVLPTDTVEQRLDKIEAYLDHLLERMDKIEAAIENLQKQTNRPPSAEINPSTPPPQQNSVAVPPAAPNTQVSGADLAQQLLNYAQPGNENKSKYAVVLNPRQNIIVGEKAGKIQVAVVESTKSMSFSAIKENDKWQIIKNDLTAKDIATIKDLKPGVPKVEPIPKTSTQRVEPIVPPDPGLTQPDRSLNSPTNTNAAERLLKYAQINNEGKSNYQVSLTNDLTISVAEKDDRTQLNVIDIKSRTGFVAIKQADEWKIEKNILSENHLARIETLPQNKEELKQSLTASIPNFNLDIRRPTAKEISLLDNLNEYAYAQNNSERPETPIKIENLTYEMWTDENVSLGCTLTNETEKIIAARTLASGEWAIQGKFTPEAIKIVEQLPPLTAQIKVKNLEQTAETQLDLRPDDIRVSRMPIKLDPVSAVPTEKGKDFVAALLEARNPQFSDDRNQTIVEEMKDKECIQATVGSTIYNLQFLKREEGNYLSITNPANPLGNREVRAHLDSSHNLTTKLNPNTGQAETIIKCNLPDQELKESLQMLSQPESEQITARRQAETSGIEI